jgi:O-antigen ligase
VFFLPSQLALHFWPQYAFVFGIRVDYLAPAIYFTDILIAALFVLVIFNDRTNFLGLLKRNKNALLMLLVVSIFNIVFSESAPISLFKWVKIFEALFFGAYFYLRKSFLGKDRIIKTLFISALLFSLIGIAQVVLSHTTGLFYLFGERSFRLSTPGIALAMVWGAEYLRAYSTFPHPNVLAGYLGLVLIVFAVEKPTLPNHLFYTGLLAISFALFLTFSSSAWLGLVVLYILFLFKTTKSFNKLLIAFLAATLIFSVSLPVLSEKINGNVFSSSTSQRLSLANLSGKIIGDNFLFGSGLNTFILNVTSYGGMLKHPWLLQPVHNIILLVFAEVGIVGVLLLSWFFYKISLESIKRKNYLLIMILFFVLITGVFDHYWLTLQQGFFSMSLFLGLFFSKT